MNALLRDFMGRWWWVLLASSLVTALTVFGSTPVIVAPLGAVLLLIDAQRGGIRVLRSLPVHIAEQGRFCWIVSVVLVPAVSAAAMIAAGVVRELVLPPDPHLWFRMGVQVWIAFGYAAAGYILIVFLPTRPGETLQEKVEGGVAGALWGFAIAGFFVIYPNLPRAAGQIATWHWVLFIMSPLLFIASVPFREELLRRRSVPLISSAPRSSRASGRLDTPGLTGIPLFLATIPTRAAGMTILVYVSQLIFLWLFLREKGGGVGALASMGAIQTGIMGIMFASFTTMWIGVRALRVLPISSRLLAALLVSPALAIGILTAIFATLSTLAGPTRPLPVQPWELGLLVFGVATVGLALMIRYPKIGAILLIALMAMVTPLIFFITTRAQGFTSLAPYVGGFFALAGYLFIVRMLRRTSDVYRAPGIFGIGAWSPQQQR